MKTPYDNNIDYKDRLDESVRAQDDFFGFVNNKWLAANPIPKSESKWGAFILLIHRSFYDLRSIYEDLVLKDAKPGSLEQITKDFYETGLHFNDYSDRHLAIMDSYCQKINNTKTKSRLWQVLGELQVIDIDSVWGITVAVDDKDSSKHSLHLLQPSLTLPNREYYLEQSPSMKVIRQLYKAHVKKIYSLFPNISDNADELWKTVWNFEYGLAKHSRSSSDLRNIKKNYNRTAFSKLKKLYPNIDWEVFAKAVGWDTTCLLSVDQPETFQYINLLVDRYSLDEWKTYLKWSFVVKYYGKVNEQYAKLNFEFFGKAISGVKTMLPLWKRVIIRLNMCIGEDVGRLYVKKHFPASSKTQVLAMVEELRQTYHKRLQALDWMSESGKQKAIKKLNNIRVLIGYPDKWRDISGLIINRQSYLGNILSATKFNSIYNLNKLNKPTSRDEWLMSPQTVNAYNDPSRLLICFPAAILQPPFFDPKANFAINMGGIGSVICHELTHAFDDQGCQFDEHGNVRTWQTKAERKVFSKRASVIINQANQFEVLPGLNLIGKLVIGESIADLGGLEIAFDALSHILKNKINQKIEDGLTASQLIYINYAITECAVAREKHNRDLVLRDEHPDERFRVNGILPHCDGFYKAFDVKPGDKLYLPTSKRVRIW